MFETFLLFISAAFNILLALRIRFLWRLAHVVKLDAKTVSLSRYSVGLKVGEEVIDIIRFDDANDYIKMEQKLWKKWKNKYKIELCAKKIDVPSKVDDEAIKKKPSAIISSVTNKSIELKDSNGNVIDFHGYAYSMDTDEQKSTMYKKWKDKYNIKVK